MNTAGDKVKHAHEFTSSRVLYGYHARLCIIMPAIIMAANKDKDRYPYLRAYVHSAGKLLVFEEKR